MFAEGDSILGEQALIYFILALVGVGVVTLFMLVNPIASIFMMVSGHTTHTHIHTAHRVTLHACRWAQHTLHVLLFPSSALSWHAGRWLCGR